MAEQAKLGLDLTPLAQNPSNYEARDYWTEWRGLVIPQLGSAALEVVSCDDVEVAVRRISFDNTESVADGDPLKLKPYGAGNEASVDEIMAKSLDAIGAFGAFNAGQDKADWLIDSALLKLGLYKEVGQPDKILKALEKHILAGRVRPTMRHSDEPMREKHDRAEIIASEIQDAGINILCSADTKYDFDKAVLLLQNANEVRKASEALKGTKGKSLQQEVLRRRYDTKSMLLHADAMMGRDLAGVHEDFRQVQIDNVSAFLSELATRDTGRHFEWWMTILYNLDVYKSRAYGKRCAFTAMRYQDRPFDSLAREEGIIPLNSFDWIALDLEERAKALFQCKLILPGYYDPEINRKHLTCLSGDEYAQPITLVIADFDTKVVTNENGHLTRSSKRKLHQQSIDHFETAGEKLLAFYEGHENIHHLFENTTYNRIDDATWFLAAA